MILINYQIIFIDNLIIIFIDNIDLITNLLKLLSLANKII